MRARAIEDQSFVIAANQVGEHAEGLRSGGRSMIVDPWGLVLAQAADARDRDHRRPRPRRPGRDPHAAAVAGQPPPRGLPLARRLMAARNEKLAAEKRRLILDAAVRVFARQGFNQCRVSDIADEAGRRLRPRLPLLPLQGRGARHALPRALERHARRHPRPRRPGPRAAREALRDRLVHRGLLPPRPRPHEGHHRRGHARGELVRPDAPARRSPRPTS